VSAAEEAEDERHDGISNLFSSGNVHVDQPEAEIGGKGGVDGAVGGAEAEDELPWLKPALGGPWEERE